MGTGGIFLRKIRAAVEDEPTGFVWLEPGRVAGSGYPASRNQVDWLVKEGAKAILTLTEQPLPEDYLDGFDLVAGHVPMKDHQGPSTKALNEAVDFILAQLKTGRPVVVHCLAGEGRTGCVLAAYVIRTRGAGGKEAISIIRKAKPTFVEWQQEKAVEEYSDSLASAANSEASSA